MGHLPHPTELHARQPLFAQGDLSVGSSSTKNTNRKSTQSQTTLPEAGPLFLLACRRQDLRRIYQCRFPRGICGPCFRFWKEHCSDSLQMGVEREGGRANNDFKMFQHDRGWPGFGQRAWQEQLASRFHAHLETLLGDFTELQHQVLFLSQENNCRKTWVLSAFF